MKFQKEHAYIIIIVILAVALAYSFLMNPTGAAVAQNPAVNTVKSVYELLTERSVDVLRVTDESGLYRVTLQVTQRNGQTTVQEVFVTKDGRLLTDRILNSAGFTEQLTKEKAFAECLVQNRVVVAGLSNDAATLTQLQALGNFAYKVLVDCSGANLQLCQNAGVTQVPTTIFGNLNQSAAGLQPLAVYQQATGCTL